MVAVVSAELPPLDGPACCALVSMLVAGIPLATARAALRPTLVAAERRRAEAHRERLRAREEERCQLAEVTGCAVEELTYAGDGMWRGSS